jgi:hypothetical protein
MKYVAICVALYDYQAQIDDEELSFNANDTLYILENNDPDWYKAQLKVPSAQDGGPIGIIPSNYVEKVSVYLYTCNFYFFISKTSIILLGKAYRFSKSTL